MSYQNTVDEQAALELFAKQASAEGIDLEQLDDEQVEAAFAHFVENILPEMFEGEKEAEAEEVEDTLESKIAAAQNAIAFDAFVKAAAAEGVDLNDLSEDDVAELFGAWLVQDVPALFEEQAKEAELLEYAKIAEANLSEMTVMGQHLGEVAADAFLAKIAAGEDAAPGMARRALDTLKGGARRTGELLTAKNVRGDVQRHMEATGKGRVGAYADILRGGMSESSPMARTEALKSLGTQAGALGLAGLGTYGAYRGIKASKARKAARMAEGSKSASAIDERVLEILAAHGLIEG